MRVSSISKEFSCPICLELMVKTRTLQCGHSFCAGCVESSLATKRQVFERITSQWKIKLTIHPVMQTWSARHVSAESCASQVDRLQLIMSFLSSFRKTHWLRMRCVCSQCDLVCVPIRVDSDPNCCVSSGNHANRNTKIVWSIRKLPPKNLRCGLAKLLLLFCLSESTETWPHRCDHWSHDCSEWLRRRNKHSANSLTFGQNGQCPRKKSSRREWRCIVVRLIHCICFFQFNLFTYMFIVMMDVSLGLARIEYCKSTNLTSLLLDEKSLPELKQIASNLLVDLESSDKTDCVSLRDRLKMFILYGWLHWCDVQILYLYL